MVFAGPLEGTPMAEASTGLPAWAVENVEAGTNHGKALVRFVRDGTTVIRLLSDGTTVCKVMLSDGTAVCQVML